MNLHFIPNMSTLIVALILAAVMGSARSSPPPPKAAPAFFVFGDSLVDSGNNNYLLTSARADNYPYGIDYPTHKPSGRFCNGLHLPDLISEKIGSVPVFPYLSPELIGKELLVGANFASAGVGILNDTGYDFLQVLRIGQQLNYFEEYQTRITNILGPDAAQRLVKEALVLITLGSNDFINNYYLPSSIRSRQFSISDYCPFLVSEYRKVLTRMYELGARRVIVTGAGPIGCAPGELALRSQNGKCIAEFQQASMLYNTLLVQMITGLNKELESNIFIFSNAYSVKMNILRNPTKFGFVSSNIACCGQGRHNGQSIVLGLCNKLSNLCQNRSEYVFWDAFHPTERANRMIADQLMNGSVKYMNPFNLSTLMAMHRGSW